MAVDFDLRVLADHTSVVEDDIRIFLTLGRNIAHFFKQKSNTLTVVGVHLTSISLNEVASFHSCFIFICPVPERDFHDLIVHSLPPII